MPLTTNQLLKYDGSKWTNSFSALSEQSDVLIATPSSTQVLAYNGTKWINSSSPGSLSFQGVWNANTNTPSLTSSVGSSGMYYIVSVSGSTALDGNSVWRYNDIVFFNGSIWDRMTLQYIPSLRDVLYNNFNFESQKRYIEDISISGRSSAFVVKSYPTTINALWGAVNIFESDRVIMAGNSTQSVIVNPSSLAVSSVTIGVAQAYNGAVYHPSLKRYYLVPYGQGSQTQWHYFDKNASSVAYTHGVTAVNGAYAGGVYSPTQSRLYMAPFGQATQAQWHYINVSGTVVAYTHGATAVSGAYMGAVYSPTQNRIYLIPYNQGSQTQWHYIDCSTGNVVAYTHGTGITDIIAYDNGVYSPTQNRIYLIPRDRSVQPQWHYIDCSTGNVVAYTHGATVVNGGYSGGVFVPTQNRIYMVPAYQASQTQWHYIDCNTGNVVAYDNGVSSDFSLAYEAYHGGVYSPSQDRVFFSPYGGASITKSHYIECLSGKRTDTYLTY